MPSFNSSLSPCDNKLMNKLPKIMRFHLAATAGVLAFCCSSMAAPVTPPPAVASSAVRENAYPVHEVDFPNGTRGIPGIPFWQESGFRPVTLDLYLPPSDHHKPSAGFPFVVYIHGGGWLGGDPQRTGAFVDFPGVLASLAERGYAVASVGYRLSGEARFPAQIRDIKAAVRWIRLHASNYGIDPARAMAWGVSAGGHLAALAALSCGATELEPQPDEPAGRPAVEPKPVLIGAGSVSDCIQGAVAWYGVFDLATLVGTWAGQKFAAGQDPRAPVWQLLGCREPHCRTEDMAAASPVGYVDAGDPPMLLIVGSDDTTVPTAQTLEMADRLKSRGVSHELLVIPNVNHSFIGPTREATRRANLGALTATFEFIDKTLGKRVEQPSRSISPTDPLSGPLVKTKPNRN